MSIYQPNDSTQYHLLSSSDLAMLARARASSKYTESAPPVAGIQSGTQSHQGYQSHVKSKTEPTILSSNEYVQLTAISPNPADNISPTNGPHGEDSANSQLYGHVCRDLNMFYVRLIDSNNKNMHSAILVPDATYSLVARPAYMARIAVANTIDDNFLPTMQGCNKHELYFMKWVYGKLLAHLTEFHVSKIRFTFNGERQAAILCNGLGMEIVIDLTSYSDPDNRDIKIDQKRPIGWGRAIVGSISKWVLWNAPTLLVGGIVICNILRR